MTMTSRRAAIIGGVRIPFAKSFTHYGELNNQQMMTFVLEQLTKRFRLEGKTLGDVTLGAVMKHPSDWNLARECVLGTSLSHDTPGFDLTRACGTSLEASILIANKIALGQIEVGIAAGTDTNSDLPVSINRDFARRLVQSSKAPKTLEKLEAWKDFKLSELKPEFPDVVEPRTHLSMGQHTEKMAKEWKISREDQDKLTFKSHQNALAAYAAGFYEDLVVPYEGIARDTTPRESSLEKLAKLKPVFDPEHGTLTAGNSTPLTDGAAAVLLASEDYAKANQLPVLAYLVDGQVAAVKFVEGEGLLMAPTIAVSKMLDRNRLQLQDFDQYEIHEAFAAQVLCTLKAWESDEYCKKRMGREKAMGPLDQTKMNLHGGSVALGHPFAATGARIVATLAKSLSVKGGGRGLISICTAGGMGVAAILEGA
jgi:acetyl-CoA C-acetyltransferase